ncbi:hypothetical protein KQI86_18925 [Clostridium sp. MSJ-11]|uniref:Uncharacterized protein n=1 Tax=Clostridium mobile TaxID=2841512 RepID=A0ABS6EMB3_9CLOT|nr:hypothetical protein [Clostridium mobile]MBU5486377.1 hypothetical protein [Clostridium mobile]
MKQNQKNTVYWEKLIREVILLYNQNTLKNNNNIAKNKVEKTPDKVEFEKETKIEEAPNKVETIKKSNVEEPPVKAEAKKEIKIEETYVENEIIEEIKIKEFPVKTETIKEIKIEELPIKTETIKEIKIEELPVKTEIIKEIKIEELPVKTETIKEIKFEEPPIKIQTKKEIKIEETPIKIQTKKETKIEETPIKAKTIEENKAEKPPVKTETRKKKKRKKASIEIEIIKEKKVEIAPIQVESIKEKKIRKTPIQVETMKENKIEIAPIQVESMKENKVEIAPVQVESIKEKKIKKAPIQVETTKEKKKDFRKHTEHIDSKTSSSTFVVSKVIPLCSNIPVSQISSNGPLTCKLPVILSQFQVQIDCEADIRFSKPAINIIDVKSNIHITEYSLIVDANKLFISGYIRESIQYNNISSKAKHITVNIPFQCVTRVEFTTPPVLQKNKPNIKYNLINGSMETIGEDDYNDLFFSNNEVFNEKIYCELLSAEILQIVTKLDNAKIEKYNGLVGCERTKNKFSLGLTIRLCQNQPVNI